MLSKILDDTELKYARTTSHARGNRIVRRWQHSTDNVDGFLAMSHADRYARIHVGAPPQVLEVDIDMLTPDFYTILTSSGQGSKYDTFRSSTQRSGKGYAHNICRETTETLNLPKNALTSIPIHISFPVCQPPKYSINTLHKSGSILGLAPPISSSLSQLSTPTLLEELLAQNQIQHNIFSLTLLDDDTGILSLGATIAPQVEEFKIRSDISLRYLDTLHNDSERQKMEDEVSAAIAFTIPPGSTHEHHFKWTDVGAGATGGWHMTLVSGIWVNGVKILKNQPAIFDINCPFVLAPSPAVEAVYTAIPGARQLETLFQEDWSTSQPSPFYVWPCLNTASIEFEIAGWRFPLAKGSGTKHDDLHGPFGGKFSLGRVTLNQYVTDRATENIVSTGYCVGVIAETTMSRRRQWSAATVDGVWVLGEPFFKDLGIVFDMGSKNGKGQRVGVRVY